MVAHPCHVLVLVRRIHDDKKAVFGAPIDDQVVDHAAVFVAQRAVAAFSDRQFGEIVRHEVIERCKCTFAFERDLPHVGHVEQAAGRAHRFVLFHQSGGIFDRKRKACERHDLPAGSHVNVVKGCPFLHWQSLRLGPALTSGAGIFSRAPLSVYLKDLPRPSLVRRDRDFASSVPFGGQCRLRLSRGLSDPSPFA